MTIWCGFRNNQEMAKAVCEAAQQIEGKRYTPRPWNRFEPENTDWWIVPTTEWPAYRYGKGMFKRVDYLPGRLLICLYIEKGFAPVVAEAYSSLATRGQILDDQWTWHRFVAGLSNGSVLRAIEQFDPAIELILEVSAWYPSEYEAFDPYSLPRYDTKTGEDCRSPEDAGLVWFGIRGESLVPIGQRCMGEILAPISKCRRLADLGTAMLRTPTLSWTWIDISIGMEASLLPESQAAQEETWDGARIWKRLLRPWLPWIA